MGLDEDDDWPSADAFRVSSDDDEVKFTPGERRAMDLVAQGFSNSQIAKTLGIKENSVERHLPSVYRKLGLSHRPDINPRVAATLYWLGLDKGLLWRVFCEFCPWSEADVETRREAVALGHQHITDQHGPDEEYAFRVQGFRRKHDAAQSTQ